MPVFSLPSSFLDVPLAIHPGVGAQFRQGSLSLVLPFPVLGRGFPGDRLKGPVEGADVVKAALVADFGDGLVCALQRCDGAADADLVDVFV